MPGIAGIMCKDPYEGIEADLTAMVDVMQHENFYRRGQYANRNTGTYVGWTLHESSFADCMPLVSREKDVILIFQGEHFSNEILADRRAGNDTYDYSARYLLAMYEKSGADFIRQLNGWFSGVLIDLRSETTILFNDRYGMGRVYIHEEDDVFLFSSEAKSLLKVRPKLRAIDSQGLAQYLRFNCVLKGGTLFKDIRLLPNASSWEFSHGTLKQKRRYFDQSEWEQQPVVTGEEFYSRFAETIGQIVPKYVRGRQRTALALSGGLDTRLIEAALLPARNGLSAAYTFGGSWGETLDITKARQIAEICDQSHETIRLEGDFFKDFPALATASVYLSDGAHDAFGAHDVYLNRIARRIAPVRLTGKFGSEVVKSRRLIPWTNYADEFFEPNLRSLVNELRPRDRFQQRHSLSNTVFEEIGWYESGRVAVEQCQVTLRTPYLDNDLVKLMFQADSTTRCAGQLQPRYIKEKAPTLNTIITNMGGLGDGGPLAAKLRYIFYRALFKTEYYYLFATPHWVTWLDRRLEKLHLESIVSGREKFEGYRIWIKSHFADFVTQTLSNPTARYVEFFDRKCVQRMVRRHIAGTHNYLNEINKVLTVELINLSLLTT